jgi:acyl carrier protein
VDPLELEVYRLVARERSEPIERISPATRLGADLGMDGDDAVEFFQAYEKAFQVDISAL